MKYEYTISICRLKISIETKQKLAHYDFFVKSVIILYILCSLRLSVLFSYVYQILNL